MPRYKLVRNTDDKDWNNKHWYTIYRKFLFGWDYCTGIYAGDDQAAIIKSVELTNRQTKPVVVREWTYEG